MKYQPKFVAVVSGFVVGIVYIALRFPHLSHPLTWDEGMNLLSLRSFLEGVDTSYSSWLTRHPPLYLLYLALSANESFPVWSAKAVLMNMVLGVVMLGILFHLVKQIWNPAVAWVSCAVYAILPATVFFDVWIKRDLMTNTLGLLALLLFVKRKWMFCGVALGLALLTKMLAVVYILPILAALVFQHEEYPRKKGVLILGIAALVSGWWYLFISDTNLHILSFITGIQLVETESWHREGVYVLKRLPLNLGVAGCMLAVLGVVFSGKNFRGNQPDRIKVWPILISVPYMIVLSFAKGKTPWLIIPALPAFAVLIAIGVEGVWTAEWGKRFAVIRVLLILPMVAMIWNIADFDYEAFLKNQDPGLAWGTLASTQAADLINETIPADETFAVSPFNYWTEQPGVICPILLTRLQQWPDHQWSNYKTPEQLENRIKETEIDWVLVSPLPAEAGQLLRPLNAKGAEFHVLDGSILVDARKLR